MNSNAPSDPPLKLRGGRGSYLPDTFNGVRPKATTIYSRGREELLSKDLTRLAIVGSRRMSDYGRRVIEEWVPMLVQRGIVTVSGLMTGVDQRIHEETMACGGRTIGIAGWGLDWSKDNNISKLQNKIVQADGLLLSEYHGDTAPQLWMFPARNRLVAWISTAVLVVEAGEKSGSIITANWAKKYNKKLLVVPGSVFSSVSKGANLLIKEGGTMVRNPEEILHAMAVDVTLNLFQGRSKREGSMLKQVQHDIQEKQITVALESGPKMLDEMVKILGVSAEKLSAKLTMMEIMGEVKNRNGRYEL